MSTSTEPQTPQALFSAPRRRDVVKRWDGATQTTTAWDGLRRDAELWLPEDDCAVYLYRRGSSRRGPSFIVPYVALKAVGCDSWLFDNLDRFATSRGSISASSDDSFSSYSPISTTGKREIYIGSSGLTKQESFESHLTTRNFFAWVMGKPLVGEYLSRSLDCLLERLKLYRGNSIDNLQGLLDYAQDMGYLNMADCPDYALAMLQFAEKNKLRNLYIEAFAHCVGMNDRLSDSVEFPHISKLSKALISRAYLEMDLHVDRATYSIGTFLEDELSPAHLGLFKHARMHLEDFRSFLQTYSIASYGYWPPTNESGFSKSLYEEMKQDFLALYEYLADKDILDSTKSTANGGICVLQNVEAFNSRHKYPPLPYALPRLPLLPSHEGLSQTQRMRKSLGLGIRESTLRHRESTIREALNEATNTSDDDIIFCPLVQSYMQFEGEHASDDVDHVSVADARRVRWILIYAMVQVLSSLTHSPAEVREPDAAPYPLCCLTIGLPPWDETAQPVISTQHSRTSSARSTMCFSSVPSVPSLSGPSSPATSIHPDCEETDYYDYLPNSKRNSSYEPLSIDLSNGINLKRSLSKRLPGRFNTIKLSTSRPATPPLSLNRRQSQAAALVSDHKRTSTWSPSSNAVPWTPQHVRSHSTMSRNSVVLSMPALFWNNDVEGTPDNSSSSGGEVEDELLSPELEQSNFFNKSFDPYYGAPKEDNSIGLGDSIEGKMYSMWANQAPVATLMIRNLSLGKEDDSWTVEDILGVVY